MECWKAHGLGNDYLVWEGKSDFLTPSRVKLLCHRHLGLGADGILEPILTEENGFGVVIWNPDGSIAEKSGNGLRIFAHWLHFKRGAPSSFRVSTGECSVQCSIQDSTISVEMGRATFKPEEIPTSVKLWNTLHLFERERLRLWSVGIGNPHCVSFFDSTVDLDQLPWRAWGKELEVDPRFPNRSNIQFAQVLNSHTIQMRIWERGAGETSASGSSASAVSAVAIQMGWCKSPIEVIMPGGRLSVKSNQVFDIQLRGPVEPIGTFRLSEALRKRLRNLESE